MRSRVTALIAALCLVVSAQVPAQEKASFEPAVVLRARDLDSLIADLRYLFKKAGREKEAKALEDALKGKGGAKGLEGIDTTKPFGIAAEVAAKLTDSRVWLLLPVADEKAVLDYLEGAGREPKKQADGTYRVKVEGIPLITSGLIRFAHGYLYATLKLSDTTTLPAADKLPTPAAALGRSANAVSVAVNIDKVPPPLRKLAVSFLGLQLGNAKEEKVEAETEAAKALRWATIDELTALIKSLLEDGERLEIALDLDTKKADELSLSASLSGRKGTKLAKDLASLAAPKSAAAGIVTKDALLTTTANVELPASLKKAMAGVVDEQVKKGLDMLQEHEKEVVEPLTSAVTPSLKAGVLDVALHMRPPGKGGRYTIVMASRLKDGAGIEKTIKATLKKLPPKDRESFGIDIDRAGGVNVHSIRQKNVDENAKKLIGDGPLYLAIRDDAVFLAVGEEALAAVKEAAASRPTEGQPFRLELSMRELAAFLSLIAPDMKKAPEAAREAFKGGAADRTRLTVRGGERLEVRFGIATGTITFAALLDRLRKE